MNTHVTKDAEDRGNMNAQSHEVGLRANDAGRVLRSATVVGSFTAVSRLAGFFRELLMAYFFGTSLAKSAFDVSFKIPNLFRRLFGEGALSAAFIPVFTETMAREGIREANRLAARIMTMLGFFLSAAAVLAIAVSVLLSRTAPSDSRAALVLSLLAIMLPYMVFICVSALCMGILNSFHRFALPAASPVILNLVWIACLIFVRPLFGDTLQTQIYGIAWGVLAAGVLQMIVLFPAMRRVGVNPAISFSWNDSSVRRVLALMGPAALGMGVVQLNVVIDGLLALWVGNWAPAALTYAERLVYLPLGLFATALSTVLLPTYSHKAAANRTADITNTLAVALKNLMLVMTPTAAIVAVLALPIVTLVYQWKSGLFDADSGILTARALVFYAPGLLVFSVYKLLAPAFYAIKDTKTPVRVGLWSVMLNLTLNIAFMLTWPEGYRHAGLAFATVLSSLFNSIVLAAIFTRRVGNPGWPQLARQALLILLCSACMAAVLRFSHMAAAGLIPRDSKGGQLFALAAALVCGMAAYLACAYALCRSEIKGLIAGIRRC